MRNINFNSKATYLAYRSAWKAEYNKLSQDIREWKAYIRSEHTPSWEAYRDLREMKETATNMIAERHASKEEAQRQYLAAKAQNETVSI